MTKTNSISISSMQNSQVQQDVQNSSQHFDQITQNIDLKEFTEAFSRDIPKISNQAVAQSLLADIDTIKAQNLSPAPKKSIIRECLTSIKTTLEGAAGNVLASYVPIVAALMAGL